MRSAMEAWADASIGKQLAFWVRKGPTGQVAGSQQRDDSRDIRLHGQRGQVVMELDVVVELIGDAGRQRELGHLGRRFRRNLNATFDFANLVGVLTDGLTIPGPQVLPEAVELAAEGIENA